METTHISVDGRMIPLSIRRHSRARRISLRLSAARDGIVMTLPLRASVASGMKFFSSKARWVLANVEEGAAMPFRDGALLPMLGETCRIRLMPGRGVSHLAEGELRIHGAPEFVPRRVRDFLKKYLRETALPRAKAAAGRIGKDLRDLKVRDTRSRWGSCTTGGIVTLHWQLIFAPPEILDYLIAHEVAHLKEMNHSKRFWGIVETLCPDYVRLRNWLKTNGHLLHRYGK